ncbi:MAG: hypothetical protein RLZ53_553 [Actinomycetota bacterium]|jgi:glucose uptake protein GlcU
MQYLAEAATHWVPPFPTVVFGVIAMAVFILMGLVTWSYRDVSNRHEHHSNDSNGHH